MLYGNLDLGQYWLSNTKPLLEPMVTIIISEVLWYLGKALDMYRHESEGWESPLGREIFCPQNFDTLTRAPVRL